MSLFLSSVPTPDVAGEAQIDEPVRGKWAAWVGFFLHLVVGVFPYAASGLLAPLYGIVIIYAGWFALLVLALKWWNKTPYRVLLIPVIALVWWFALLNFGDFVLGWTA